jgi:hypothetical protein
MGCVNAIPKPNKPASSLPNPQRGAGNGVSLLNGARRRNPARLTARATVSGVKGFCRNAGGAVEGSAALLP